MRNKLLAFAGVIGMLTLLGHFYAKPLLAQVRAALVQDMDSPGRHPYQASTSFDPTTGTFPVFPPVPIGLRLVLEQLNIATINPGNEYGAVFISSGNHITSGNHIVFRASLSTDPIGSTRQLSDPLALYFDSGQQFYVGFLFTPFTATAAQAQITVTAHLIDCSAAGSCAPIAP